MMPTVKIYLASLGNCRSIIIINNTTAIIIREMINTYFIAHDVASCNILYFIFLFFSKNFHYGKSSSMPDMKKKIRNLETTKI
jgi:hypothetical protein